MLGYSPIFNNFYTSEYTIAWQFQYGEFSAWQPHLIQYSHVTTLVYSFTDTSNSCTCILEADTRTRIRIWDQLNGLGAWLSQMYSYQVKEYHPQQER